MPDTYNFSIVIPIILAAGFIAINNYFCPLQKIPIAYLVQLGLGGVVPYGIYSALLIIIVFYGKIIGVSEGVAAAQAIVCVPEREVLPSMRVIFSTGLPKLS